MPNVIHVTMLKDQWMSVYWKLFHIQIWMKQASFTTIKSLFIKTSLSKHILISYRVTVLKMVHELFYSDQICTKKMSYHLICKIISDLCHAFYGMHVFTFLILLLKILIFPNFHLLHRRGRCSVTLSHILDSPHDKKCQTFL